MGRTVCAESSIKDARVQCEKEMGIEKGVIQDVGLTINENKTEMGQELVLLGVALPTIADKGRKCTATLTEKRKVLIASK